MPRLLYGEACLILLSGLCSCRFMVAEKHVYKNGLKMLAGGYNWTLARIIKQHIVDHTTDSWEKHGRTGLFIASTPCVSLRAKALPQLSLKS